ncbi:aldehyde dehydrogenase family protein [Asanoa sp. WMMD1127]|uniref:aldehyde dehydrogenase family protein n=1 Tax=Asanoa sp. WMMD1127 TaxID=3016107 RepID=UPI00241599F7|nr:aldehyde dehydrogenase family protein [Asanoa sp. WMMD1127]MDG4825283.1 aldehyde dehydrogenase family protein [Asanoa sp. WMMD1127]
MNDRSIFVNGEWVAAHGRELIPVIDPSTEQCVATVPECSTEDVDDAVRAAWLARPALRALTVDDRVASLRRLADELERRAGDLADRISLEMGMPRHLCGPYQVASAIGVLRTTADELPTVAFRERIGHSWVVREPVGVVVAITPWNYPLLQTTSKIGPALAAGCPVVLKPSELAPLDAYLLAEAVAAAGLPPGAVNVVMGTGPHVGESLARHPQVAMVSLTGSTRAGRRVAQVAAASVKRVALELGGKSPSVVLADADLAAAVRHTVDSVLVNSGQTCTALTRLVVPYQRLGEVEELVSAAMAGYRVGPAAEPTSDLGPVANAAQLQRVREHVERAEVDGARPLWAYPGDRLPEKGFFAAPAAFVIPDPTIDLARSEVFGPVLSVIPYVDEDDAVAIANATDYGLAATVWSADEEHALRVAERIESGTVDLNGAPFNGRAPFGGYKQSGRGRELGRFGIEEFTELKSIQTGVGG